MEFTNYEKVIIEDALEDYIDDNPLGAGSFYGKKLLPPPLAHKEVANKIHSRLYNERMDRLEKGED